VQFPSRLILACECEKISLWQKQNCILLHPISAVGGMQLTYTAGNLDLPAMALAAGFASAAAVSSDNEFKAALPAIRSAKGPGFWSIKIRAEDNPIGVMPPNDGVTLKDRFRAALLGAA